MKKLLFALALALACGTMTFANESDSTEQIYNPFKQFDYEIVVMKKLKNYGSGPHMIQFLHRETGRNTMAWINNRINVLKQNYPGTPQEPITVANIKLYDSSDFDPILISHTPELILEAVLSKDGKLKTEL